MFVCVCVRERDREREQMRGGRERERERERAISVCMFLSLFLSACVYVYRQHMRHSPHGGEHVKRKQKKSLFFCVDVQPADRLDSSTLFLSLQIKSDFPAFPLLFCVFDQEEYA